jgi:two-component system response regulator AtoC
MPRSILLIDDDPAILYLHSRFFQGEGWEVFRAMNGEAGLELYATHIPDVVLLDLSMPGMHGFEVLQRLVAQNATVILLTAHGEVENAVRAMKLGAENFVTKPAKLPHLEAIVGRAVERVELRRANQHLVEQLGSSSQGSGLGSSAQMRALARQVELLAASDHSTVLLTGESGTGKGWVAKMLHARSARAHAPLVEINCAGLSAAFLDSELFGHEKGAFTDAKTMKRGLFEVAHGGTLFLDEIGDLAPELQPKLLKAIESRSFRRLGGTQEIRADVRLVAATNKKLEQEIAAGRFREDLFYRLNVLPVRLPALRERATEDVLELIQSLLAELSTRRHASAPRISDGAMALLVRFDWPGNVRQMRNVLERALVVSAGEEMILPEHLPAELHALQGGGLSVVDGFRTMSMKEVERRHIEHTLIAFGGNRTHAATALGISRATLHNKIRSYGLAEIGRVEVGT